MEDILDDGIDNSEHILDMQKQVEMLIENISDNTDSAFDILKLHDDDKDQDLVDVYRIICNDILDCEKLAKQKVTLFQKGVQALESSADAVKKLQEFENLFDEINRLEKSSDDLLKSLINKLSQEEI